MVTFTFNVRYLNQNQIDPFTTKKKLKSATDGDRAGIDKIGLGLHIICHR